MHGRAFVTERGAGAERLDRGQDLAYRAKGGRGASAMLSAETREAAHLPCLAGEQGSELTGADVLSADELEGCEIGERKMRGDARGRDLLSLPHERRAVVVVSESVVPGELPCFVRAEVSRVGPSRHHTSGSTWIRESAQGPSMAV
jgi:hypothetical protein